MFQKIFSILLGRRHFWRHATFSEVAELYVSRILRMSAINIVGAFMSIYMYQIGYSVFQIALFWAAFYLFKVFIALPSTWLVAKIGPKHATLISNILYIPSSIAFAMLPLFGDGLLPIIIFFQGISISLYGIAYNIDFSKVKSIEHAGKEIAIMNIIDRLAAGLSPVIGGVVAYLAGPQATIVLSSILFTFAALPLMRTGEPVKTGVSLKFKAFPWRLLWRQSGASWAAGFDLFSSGSAWTLYVAILVIGVSSNNEVYLISGLLMSIVFIVAFASSYVYGKLIDKKRGGFLLRVGAIGVSITHFIRPFMTNTGAVAGMNAANEVATTAFTLPYVRGVYDNADLSGMRREYIGLIEMIVNIGAACGSLALAGLAVWLGAEEALRYFFFVAAAATLLMLSGRFPLYKR